MCTFSFNFSRTCGLSQLAMEMELKREKVEKVEKVKKEKTAMPMRQFDRWMDLNPQVFFFALILNGQ